MRRWFVMWMLCVAGLAQAAGQGEHLSFDAPQRTDLRCPGMTNVFYEMGPGEANGHDQRWANGVLSYTPTRPTPMRAGGAGS